MVPAHAETWAGLFLFGFEAARSDSMLAPPSPPEHLHRAAPSPAAFAGGWLVFVNGRRQRFRLKAELSSRGVFC
ncbi:unnamed protein product [Amoebophrya sp. A120]|nr:unnamed protein product [Amoebophrya sp. A120]|eukprot:GSA120T00026387001.1